MKTSKHILFALLLQAAACANQGASQEQVSGLGGKADSVATDAELAEFVRTVTPRVARNGTLRFSYERLRTPAAAPLLLERFENGGESEEARRALAIALSKTGGSYANEVAALMQQERSPRIRVSLVDALRLARDATPALDGLRSAMNDESPMVRENVVRAIGRHPRGPELEDVLMRGLNDEAKAVQAQALRALAAHRTTTAWESMRALLASNDADVRLEALRGMARVDPGRTQAMPELGTLGADRDPRIQRAVATAKAGGY